MIIKIFFSLLGLLASLLGVWGVVRLGWTWELAFPAVGSLFFLGVALAAGNKYTGHSAAMPGAGPSVDEGSRQGVTQRYEWGELTGQGSSASGPSSF